MRLTPLTLAVYAASDSTWRSTWEIAEIVGVPAENLKTTFQKLVSNDVLEKDAEIYPALYRRHQSPGEKALKLLAIIENRLAAEDSDVLSRVRQRTDKKILTRNQILEEAARIAVDTPVPDNFTHTTAAAACEMRELIAAAIRKSKT